MPATVRSVARSMNRSARSFDDVTRLATRAPEAAKTYLQDVAARLKQFGQVAKAKSIEDLLEQPDLAASMKAQEKQLGKIWPDNEGGWGALQAERSSSIYWTPVETNKLPPVYVTGEVKVDSANNSATLVTENGLKLNLVGSSDSEMGTWFSGLAGDGPLTLKGKMDVNGNFKVQGFALDTDGKFKDFTFGRVQVSERRVYIDTPEGEVNITNEELKKKLKNLPMLGIILPGEPTGSGSRKKYDHNPDEFFALGRFVDTTIKPAEGNVHGKHALCDMAYSKFASQPFVLPPGQERRADHSERFWARGDFKYLREETGQYGYSELRGHFAASYLSKASDDLYLSATEGSDADAVQAAVMLAEADDDLEGVAKPAR